MEYTTERGKAIELVPIPLLLGEIRATFRKREPEVPQWSEDVSGELVYHDITPDIAEVSAQKKPEWWAQYADAWDEYQEAMDELGEEQNDAILNAIILKGCRFEIPPDEEWVPEQEIMGLRVPSGLTERKIHYFRTEIIGGIRDIVRLTVTCEGGEIDDETLALAEDSFRGILRGTLRGEMAK